MNKQMNKFLTGMFIGGFLMFVGCLYANNVNLETINSKSETIIELQAEIQELESEIVLLEAQLD